MTWPGAVVGAVGAVVGVVGAVAVAVAESIVIAIAAVGAVAIVVVGAVVVGAATSAASMATAARAVRNEERKWLSTNPSLPLHPSPSPRGGEAARERTSFAGKDHVAVSTK